jgi:hypothetical protein
MVEVEPIRRVERHRDVRRLTALVLVAVIAAGCVGSSSAGSSQRERPVAVSPHIEMMITYAVPTCPEGARCVQAPREQDFYWVSRQLTCSPDGGNYPDPHAACRALRNVLYKRQTLTALTDCVGIVNPARAVGYYDGRKTGHPAEPVLARRT